MNIKQVVCAGLLVLFAENAFAGGTNNSYVAQPRPVYQPAPVYVQPRPVYQPAPVYVQPRQQPAVAPAPSNQSGCTDGNGRSIPCQQNQQQLKQAVPVQRNVAPQRQMNSAGQPPRPIVSNQPPNRQLDNSTGTPHRNATLAPTGPSSVVQTNRTPASAGNAVLSRSAIKASIEPALAEINKLTPVISNIGSLKDDVKSRSVSQVPQSIKDTREVTTRYLEQKMPSTDSWLYRKTNFVDNPAIQKIVKLDQKALDEVGKIAPVTTSAGTLSRDVFSGQIDKLPGDVKSSRQAMTDYFAEKMPSTSSALYKGTNFIDKPSIQRFIKVDQRVLTAIETF